MRSVLCRKLLQTVALCSVPARQFPFSFVTYNLQDLIFIIAFNIYIYMQKISQLFWTPPPLYLISEYVPCVFFFFLFSCFGDWQHIDFIRIEIMNDMKTHDMKKAWHTSGGRGRALSESLMATLLHTKKVIKIVTKQKYCTRNFPLKGFYWTTRYFSFFSFP